MSVGFEMSKPELGSKRVCVSCAARFYDLTRVPAVCPKCEAPQPAERPRPVRQGRMMPEDRRMKSRTAPLPAEAEAPAADAESEEAEDEDAVAEDDADDVEEIGVPSVDITS